MGENEKREKLIETLKRIITDLEKGYDGFMYLYDIIRKNCKHSCLRCEYFDDCVEVYDTVAVEHKGYTIQQSGVNCHTMIIDSCGKLVYHAQTEKPLTEQELRQIVDWYIDFIKEDMQL